MAIELRREELKQIEEHGREAYPDECCGALLGREVDGHKVITHAMPLRNSRQQNRGDQPTAGEEMNLLKDAYRLMQQMGSKSDLIREWLERADGVVNSARNRFRILPEDFMITDREATRQGVKVLGFYHSHPDHPARPSEYDREHLLCPWYTAYLILAVEKAVPRELTGWTIAEDGQHFAPENVRILMEQSEPGVKVDKGVS